MSKVISAHQPLFIPWLGFFEKIDKADLFVLLDTVQYDPNDFQNRNYIKTANGKLLLTVPVRGGRNQLIKDVQIDNSRNWQKKHLRSIELAYKKAPYFDKYFLDIKNIYENNFIYLSDLNAILIKWFCYLLEIKTKIVKASDYNFTGSKSGLVLSMCCELEAVEYWFGEQGENYCDKQSFLDAGVKPLFQSYQHPVYKQLHGEFQSHMSILDLLFNMGDKSLNILSEDNEI